MKHHTFVSLLFFFNLSLVTGCHENEREALLDFKSFVADLSNRLSSWQGLNCCSWHGIYCSKSWHIVSVNLENPAPDRVVINGNKKLVSMSKEQVAMSTSISSALKGTISSSLFTLSHLRFLDLSFNNFMSSKIPTGLSNLTSLTHLNLSNAMFEDSIVAQLANLTSLRVLDLSCSYEVPDVSSISYNLTLKKVNGGSLHSFIHRGSLHSSNLKWLEGLHNLRELRLAGVDFYEASQSNKWAEPISLLSNLRSLHLFNCRVLSAIPINQLLNLIHLYSLRMDSNSFTSPIPNQLANLTSILIFGTVPNSLGNYTSLISLNLGGNNFSENIPSEIEGAKNLSYLDLSGNHFEGLFPSFIQKLEMIEVLKLAHNIFEGKIPQFIGDLKNLCIILLAWNFFNGSIPEEITKLEKLQYMDFSNNEFSGPIPEKIDGMRMLTSQSRDAIPLGYFILLLLVGVNIEIVTKGSSYQLERVYTYISGIDLSCNTLTGNIPQEIGLLHGLYMLNL
ncbi:hypothetical protein F0562_017569 [Nyssa sinensis]|uniref:Uncharacterized protein n=1 Tax=Nyssa sinensis TaxID=561372 RepID=A0A5J4ZHZ9_9ASTE|nr:hypothetical protein F0562_017569 [Nyssa sinensis]